jgi:hypothetical protein
LLVLALLLLSARRLQSAERAIDDKDAAEDE